MGNFKEIPSGFVEVRPGEYEKPKRADRIYREPETARQMVDRLKQTGDVAAMPIKPRIRQSSKPLMNGLETRFHNHMQRKHPDVLFHPQGITFRLANGLRYTPDFTACIDGDLFAFEVKGKWIDGDSVPKIKMFASVYPEWTVLFCWEHNGGWQQQLVKP